MQGLVEQLVNQGVLRSPALINAFERVDRRDFVPQELSDFAYVDTALPIGWGQTISQPYVVAFMLELLGPEAKDHILDVGYGSGWQTALLAQVVGEKGRVYAIELVKELCFLGKANVQKYPELAKRTEFYCQSASLGLLEVSKKVRGFNGIIAAAGVQELPSAWRVQLKVGGLLVYPKGESIFREVKKSENAFERTEYKGFAFVPFVHE